MIEGLSLYPEYHRFIVLPFNDDAAIGALEAARKLCREKDVVITGMGVAPVVREEVRDPDSRIVGSTAFWPEQYGDRIIKIAKKILNGERVPNAITMKHQFITKELINQVYPVVAEKKEGEK
jgi:ribose transport system substrate-binding protein